MTRPEPPIWLWLWFPPLLLILEQNVFHRSFYYFDTLYPDWLRVWFSPVIEILEQGGERGLVELATPLCSALAVVAGIAALRHRARLPTGWLRGWVALVTLACMYLTGEELAWGQNQFGFNSPEWWPHAVFNLHSLEPADINRWWGPYLVAFSEEVPRLLLELFVLFGIIRVLVRASIAYPAALSDWFWPSPICLPTALLAILVRMPERLQIDLLSVIAWHNWRRLQELYFALFLLFYLWSIWYRLGESSGTAHASTGTSASKQAEPLP